MLSEIRSRKEHLHHGNSDAKDIYRKQELILEIKAAQDLCFEVYEYTNE